MQRVAYLSLTELAEEKPTHQIIDLRLINVRMMPSLAVGIVGVLGARMKSGQIGGN